MPLGIEERQSPTRATEVEAKTQGNNKERGIEEVAI